MPMYSKVYIL